MITDLMKQAIAFRYFAAQYLGKQLDDPIREAVEIGTNRSALIEWLNNKYANITTTTVLNVVNNTDRLALWIPNPKTGYNEPALVWRADAPFPEPRTYEKEYGPIWDYIENLAYRAAVNYLNDKIRARIARDRERYHHVSLNNPTEYQLAFITKNLASMNRSKAGTAQKRLPESATEAMFRWPLITAHMICHSLGYATPSTAARITLAAKLNDWRLASCEWINHCYKDDPGPALKAAIANRHGHRGFMADFRQAHLLVLKALAYNNEPQFASWF